MNTAEQNCPDCGCELCQCPDELLNRRELGQVEPVAWMDAKARRRVITPPMKPEEGDDGWIPLYDHAKPCARCAEDGGGCTLSGPGRGDCEHAVGLPGISIPGQHDGLDDTVDAYGKPNGWCWSCWKSHKLATLEAELSGLRSRYTRLATESEATIAQQAERVKELEKACFMSHVLYETGEDGCPDQAKDRNGEVVLGVCKNCDRVESELVTPCDHRKQLAAAQARIDELMLEYCPEDMTPEQIENWAAHQRPATTEEQAAINAAIATSREGKS